LPIQILKDVLDGATGELITGQVIFSADNMLNSIFPKILPFILTLFVYWLYSKKKWTPLKLMGMIFVLACVLTGIGYWTGVY